MKYKYILLPLLLLCIALPMSAQTSCEGKPSKEQFRAWQKSFFVKKLSLTDREADALFPLYYELADKKRAIHMRMREQMKRADEATLTDNEYSQLADQIVATRLEVDELDKAYMDKFSKILTPRKLYLFYKTEMNFHRHMLEAFGKGGKK